MNRAPAVIAATPGARFAPYHYTSAAANTRNPIIRAMLFQAAADLKRLEALNDVPRTVESGVVEG